MVSGELDRFEMAPRRSPTDHFVLNNPITVSAKALSYELPTRPTDGVMPMSASRSLYRIDRYTCGEYRALLQECNAKPSMSRKGCCWDNTVAESFFHTLKNELIHGEDYRTREQPRGSIFEYIGPFYNRKRRHTTANGQSPMNYERDYRSNP